MRLFVSALLFLVVCQAATSRMFMRNVYTAKTDHFGREFLVQEGYGFTSTIINTKRDNHLFTPERATKNMLRYTDFLKSNKDGVKAKDSTILECKPEHPEFFKWTAKMVAELTSKVTETRIQSFCFNDVSFSISDITKDSLTVTINAQHKKDIFCSEPYLVSTGNHFHLQNILFPGEHKYTFTGFTADELEYISVNGIKFLRFCDSIDHIIPDLLLTAQMFIGGLGLNPDIPFFGSHVPMEMQLANVKFIEESTGYKWKARENKLIDLPAEYLQSGDQLAITRFDGLDNIIHYGSGSHQGHSVIAIWDRTQEPHQLYIVESQDAWYWPTKGLQRTKWEDWKKSAFNADFNIAILPLKKEWAAKFNEDKAWEWFRQTEGMPYGYRNFLFGWIDTVKDNYPSVLDIEFVYLVFRLLESVDKAASDQLLKEALNWRVGTKDLSLWQVEEEASRQGKSLGDLFAMTETEGHMYSDGYAYVCSSYVWSYYTKSGMLGDIVSHATEITPRDVYTSAIFDPNPVLHPACVAADPDLPYCQIMGQWKMELPGYSTIEPYTHMAEHCPSIAPDYFRPDGC